jgi:hypothetical protein
MFKNALKSWGRLVGWGREASPTAEERRVWVSYPCNLETTYQPANGAVPERFSAHVQDISRGGINLLVERPQEPGSLLSVDLPGAGDGAGWTALAYVVRAASWSGGRWAVGCTFAAELGDEDLESFGARRQKAQGPDHRRWVPFPCEAQAFCRPVRAEAGEGFPARVFNLSPNGIGLEASSPVEMGALLSLEMRGPQAPGGLTMLASVVRISTRRPFSESAQSLAEPGRELGCTFLRELTEKEIHSVL